MDIVNIQYRSLITQDRASRAKNRARQMIKKYWVEIIFFTVISLATLISVILILMNKGGCL